MDKIEILKQLAQAKEHLQDVKQECMDKVMADKGDFYGDVMADIYRALEFINKAGGRLK